MASGSAKNYNFAQKNHWRRTIWNEIIRRANGREKLYPILYLAGKNDLDRKIAVEKGVPDENLIAIDKHAPNVNAIRKDGKPAINADVLDVLWSWPKSRPVAAVLLDYCSGLEWSNTGAYDAMNRSPFYDAVCMVNFMRGRDPWSNNIRDLLRKSGLLVPMWSIDCRTGEVVGKLADAESRAVQFLNFHMLDMCQVVVSGAGYMAPEHKSAKQAQSDGGRKFLLPQREGDEVRLQAWVSKLVSAHHPKYFSYMSGNLVYDSVVYEQLFKSSSIPAPVRALLDKDAEPAEAAFKEMGVVRRIAAMLAHRTMRAAKSLSSQK